jgi:hypothetical protein
VQPVGGGMFVPVLTVAVDTELEFVCAETTGRWTVTRTRRRIDTVTEMMEISSLRFNSTVYTGPRIGLKVI